MTSRIFWKRIAGVCVALVLSMAGAGCAYDYLQHTDRVAFGAGNAVTSNLEGQTTDPSSHSQQHTQGLGKNGDVSGN
ncbi:MAG TPA: hypothetical protein ENJ68_01910 [Devosia sp.]|nr:hypothetical protein [Devosia sp.]